jgi:hypothetical protein
MPIQLHRLAPVCRGSAKRQQRGCAGKPDDRRISRKARCPAVAPRVGFAAFRGKLAALGAQADTTAAHGRLMVDRLEKIVNAISAYLKNIESALKAGNATEH